MRKKNVPDFEQLKRLEAENKKFIHALKSIQKIAYDTDFDIADIQRIVNKTLNEKENNINPFEKGSGDWEKLYNFMDENDFSCGDFLACICAHLLENDLKIAWQNFKTEIMIKGVKFNIMIEPKL